LPGRGFSQQTSDVNAELIIAPPEDDFEPSPPPPPRGGRPRLRLVVIGGVLAGLSALVAAAMHTPDFYRLRLPVGGPLAGRSPEAAVATAEQAARRLVTGGAALHSAFLGIGPWEGVFSERELNAWLAIDLPRNHASVLPASVAAPRVELLPGCVRVGAQVGRGILAATVWFEAEVALQAANQLRITVTRARLGGLPLPAGPLLAGMARRLERLGAVTEASPGGARSVLVVYIPSTHQAGGVSHWLEAIRIAAGEVAVAGETRRGPIRPAAER
jgi:hypothetical protein